jgi:hypothetical protein
MCVLEHEILEDCGGGENSGQQTVVKTTDSKISEDEAKIL